MGNEFVNSATSSAKGSAVKQKTSVRKSMPIAEHPAAAE